MDDNTKEFILALEQLSKKHGLEIVGCGGGCEGRYQGLGKMYGKDFDDDAGYRYENGQLLYVSREGHYWHDHSKEIVK